MISDEPDNTDTEEFVEDELRCGERLAAARREKQISVLDVAKELHLDEPKVRALERNDFDVLGAPVFAKGHLRKYAHLVGADEADIFADYYAMTRSAAMPPLVVARARLSKEFSPGPLIAVLIFIVVAGSGYWWFTEREPAGDTKVELAVPVDSEEQEELEPPVPEPLLPEQLQPQETLPIEEEPAIDVASANSGPARDAEPEPEPEPEPDRAPVAAAPAIVVPAATRNQRPVGDGQISVSLQFSGECWTEISDADGRRLFFNMGHDQQSADIRGKAPLSALFGNVENVSVRVNGSDYTLPAPSGSNRTVRVAIVSP